MTRLRLALVLAFVSLPILAERVVDARARSPRDFDAHALPDRIGSYTLIREDPLGPETASMLAPASYTMRLYGDAEESFVWVYFAIYSASETTGAHDPAVCYPAQGWDASAPTERVLEISDGERIAVKSMAALLAGREERVVYWFQPASRWPTTTPLEQLERMLDRLAGRSQYGFVRLSTQVIRPTDEERQAADTRLAAIAVQLAPSLRRAVTEESASGPP